MKISNEMIVKSRFLSSTADDVGANWSDHSRDLLYMVNIF